MRNILINKICQVYASITKIKGSCCCYKPWQMTNATFVTDTLEYTFTSELTFTLTFLQKLIHDCISPLILKLSDDKYAKMLGKIFNCFFV